MTFGGGTGCETCGCWWIPSGSSSYVENFCTPTPAHCGYNECPDITDTFSYIGCIFCNGKNYCDALCPPGTCTSGRYRSLDRSKPDGIVVFWGMGDLVTITDPNGVEVVNSLIPVRAEFPACPSGPGVYTIRMDILWRDCYACNSTSPEPTPTTEPTPTDTGTPTPTPTPGPDDYIIPDGDPALRPVADFTGTPLTGTAPLTVQFTDTSTRDPIAWSWYFGDGGTSEDQDPVHTFENPRTYTVRMTAANSAGADTEEKEGYVSVTQAPQVFTFSVTNTNGAWNETYRTWTWNEQARDDIIYMANYLKTDSNRIEKNESGGVSLYGYDAAGRDLHLVLRKEKAI